MAKRAVRCRGGTNELSKDCHLARWLFLGSQASSQLHRECTAPLAGHCHDSNGIRISSEVRVPSISSIACVVSVLLIASSLDGQSVNAKDRAANGISLARQGNLIQAEHELREAVKEAP